MKVYTEHLPNLLDAYTKVSRSIICKQPPKWAIWQPYELGLFTNTNITAGTLIGTYTGPTITFHEFCNNPDISIKYILWLNCNKNNITDRIGIIGENKLKYANHDRENPNMICIENMFFARDDIPAGSELTWKYGNYDI